MKKYTKYWFLENFDFMRKLGKTNLIKISDSWEMAHLSKGDSIHYSLKSEQLIIFLKVGSVKIVDNNTKTVKYLIGERSIFGEMNLYNENNPSGSNETAVCLEESIICYIPRRDMEILIEEYPSLKNSIFKFQTLRINRLERRLSDLLYKSSETRIEEFLFCFVKNYGVENHGKTCVKNTLTHKDIAHLTNTSRQTVNNVITKLRKEGKISYSRKEIAI